MLQFEFVFQNRRRMMFTVFALAGILTVGESLTLFPRGFEAEPRYSFNYEVQETNSGRAQSSGLGERAFTIGDSNGAKRVFHYVIEDRDYDRRAFNTDKFVPQFQSRGFETALPRDPQVFTYIMEVPDKGVQPIGHLQPQARISYESPSVQPGPQIYTYKIVKIDTPPVRETKPAQAYSTVNFQSHIAHPKQDQIQQQVPQFH